MKRRIFLQQSALLTAGALFAPHSWASLFQQGYTYKMLRRNVGYFAERGGNIGFLVAKESAVVIDAQFPDTAKHFLDELQKNTSNAIRYLLNTHHHGDHTGGNIVFKGLTEHVVAHENALLNHKAVAQKNNSEDKQLFADLTFSKEWKLKLDDETVKGYYFGAAHTNGDAVYHFEKANVFHTGDLVFNKRHPVVDRSAGANMRNWISVLEQIRKKASKDSLFIFGHSLNKGEETGSAETLEKFGDYLSKVLAFAEQSVRSGMTKEEFIKSTAIPGVSEWTGQGMERTLTAAYDEVSATEKK
jgi:cyclase